MQIKLAGLVSVGVLWASGSVEAQRRVAVGLEGQVYPAGIILTGQTDVTLSSNWSIFTAGGINLPDRGDAGEHENEDGHGAGGGIGLRYHLDSTQRGWFIGLRTDLWRLSIDWEDQARTGRTNVTVLQPTGTLGYRIPSGRLGVDLSVSLGAEINVQTSGEAVGEGAILLVGANLRLAR